jgi:hypothetical protein
MQGLLNRLVQLWRVFFKKPIVEIEFVPPPEIKMETNEEKLLKIARDGLDTDVSPKDLAPDRLGCAESVSNLIKKIFPDFPITTSTIELFNTLRSDKRFKLTLDPHMGVIVVSPRKGDVYGHTGIFITNERIASNDSRNGLFSGDTPIDYTFKGNYSWEQWVAEFTHKRNLHTYLFIINS